MEFNGLKRELDIPHTNGTYQWITVLEGDVKGQPDYSYMTIRNITKGRLNFQKLRITADSKVIEGVSYGKTDRDRLAPYLALRYWSSGTSKYECFYNEVTVSDECYPTRTYYAALGWKGWGSVNSSGYSGLDRDSTRIDGLPSSTCDNALMYAVWNTDRRSDAEVEYKAMPYKLSADATPTRFDWEDSGLRLWGAKMDWKTGKTYCFLVSAQVSTKVEGFIGTTSDTTFYTLYWKEKSEKTWRFHGTIMSPRNGGYLGSLYSFLECRSGADGQQIRKVRYANQWIKPVGGKWQEVLSANAMHYQDFGPNRTDKGIRIDGDGYILWSGGYLPQEGELWSGEYLIQAGELETTYQREPSNEPCPVTSADEVFFGRSATAAINMIRQTENPEYYDLKGNRIAKPERHKIYITNTGEKVIFSK